MDKWFTIATEGQTTDGRAINRIWLEQIAKTFSRATYGARIWLEHIRGTLADSPFKAYGDVLAVRTQDGPDGKMVLQAQLDPTADLVAMNKARQKIYTSCEIDPDFAKSGQAYLVGLAVTDTPASLGTDALAFCAQHPEEPNPIAGRKQRPENLFTSALPVELDFTEESTTEPESVSLLKKLITAVQNLTSKPAPVALSAQQSEAELAPIDFAKLDGLATSLADFAKKYSEDQAAQAKQITELQAQLKSLEAFKEQVSNTDAGTSQRTLATGGKGEIRTDC
jgi:hypothetical protein